MLLAAVATAESVEALGDQVNLFVKLVIAAIIVSVCFVGFEATRKGIVAIWGKFETALAGLRQSVTPNDEPRPLLKNAGYDSADQTLLHQIADDQTVQSATLSVVKTNGTLKIEYNAAAKGV